MLLMLPVALCFAVEPLVVTEDLILRAGAVIHTPLIIAADSIIIDGNGASIKGRGVAEVLESFSGVGIRSEGYSAVTIRNLCVSGFEAGLAASDGHDWCIEQCDFSDNYHDPGFGWGDAPRRGGIILTDISKSKIVNNTANRVWNACDLRYCHDNEIRDNDFSHSSNTCLKLWNSCENRIERNNLSYGIRIDPGEVHARDSASLLMESGSNGNYVNQNTVTHGGDGIFVRVLNDWISTDNLFVENDCSYANNNCIECWAPGNTFIRNKANHGSYGFWMGGSDRSVLIENEAAYNGLQDGNHNAPEPGFGHGGIVFVNAPSYHIKVVGNDCHHNNGGGIVLRGHLKSEGAKWKTQHWVIQDNHLAFNRWGIYARFADWLFLSGNSYHDNADSSLFEQVTNVTRGAPPSQDTEPPIAALSCPTLVAVGEEVIFDASFSTGNDLVYQWDFGGAPAGGRIVAHRFTRPGFCRVGLTVQTTSRADLASADLYIVKHVEEFGSEGGADQWSFEVLPADTSDEDTCIPHEQCDVSFLDDEDVYLVGRSALCLRVEPYAGERVIAKIALPKYVRTGLTGNDMLTFWLKWRNENVYWFRGPNPVVYLYDEHRTMILSPADDRNLMSAAESFNEARWGWLPVSIPISEPESVSIARDGEITLSQVSHFGIQFHSYGCEPFTVWVDGLAFE
jgi:hypothetical protein